jgi:DNA polymerase
MRLISPDFRITREHGQFVRKGSFDICAVYHPSALLRDPAKKDEMLADMLEIKRRYDALK